MLVMTAFGIPRSPLVLLAIPAAVLTGLAFAAPIMALRRHAEEPGTFNVLFRFVITPLFLFSGVFFPVEPVAEPVAARGLVHAALSRRGARARRSRWTRCRRRGRSTWRYLVALIAVGRWRRRW